MNHAYRLSPFLSRLRGRIGLKNDLEGTAARKWVIDPGIPKTGRPAIFDPADLERICGVVHDWHSIADEIDKVRGGAGFHAPTIAYELRHATLSRGALCTSKTMYPMGDSRLPLVTGRAAQHVREAVLASTGFGLKWFGHWLFDDLPLLLAANTLGTPLSALTSPSAHQARYLDLVGIDAAVGDDVHFDKLVVLQDFGQNDYKQQRHAEIRGRIAGSTSPGAFGGGVMILRGNSGKPRGMLNETEVARALSARGYRIVDPVVASADELIAACADADVVVGVEGSQLAHGAMVMRRGGALITLQPPARFSAIWNGIAEGIGIRYGFIVGHVADGGFTIDVDGLQRLLDGIRPVVH